MARLKTPPVTVVQGDDAPDIVLSLQQDSSGVPYVLTGKAAFVVLVDTADPTSYVAKFPATIEDEQLGKVRVSWVNDPVEMSSYLDSLTPGKRYELQVFLGRTDLPPSYIDIQCTDTRYFHGRYLFTGRSQGESPVFKHETQELFLSRSMYVGGGVGDYVWVITSKSEALWADVLVQDKSVLGPEDLDALPIWNWVQILDSEIADRFVLRPIVDGDVSGLGPATLPSIDVRFDGGSSQTFYYDGVQNGRPRYKPSAGSVLVASEGSPGGWSCASVGGVIATNPSNTTFPPTTGWQDNLGSIEVSYESDWVVNGEFLGSSFDPDDVLITPDGTFPSDFIHLDAQDAADTSTDIEVRGTQTVLTQIPLVVKPAYRLAE